PCLCAAARSGDRPGLDELRARSGVPCRGVVHRPDRLGLSVSPLPGRHRTLPGVPRLAPPLDAVRPGPAPPPRGRPDERPQSDRRLAARFRSSSGVKYFAIEAKSLGLSVLESAWAVISLWSLWKTLKTP